MVKGTSTSRISSTYLLIKWVFIVTFISLGIAVFPHLTLAATYCVDTTSMSNDNTANCAATCDGSNDCSLSEALTLAGNGDTVTFQAALGQINVTTAEPIPTIAAGVTIDGGSNHDVNINGEGTTGVDCFVVGGADVTIKGLSITNCKYAITNSGAYNNTTVQGNYIGLSTDGLTSAGNGRGISFTGFSSGHLIGTNGDGTNDTNERNVITSNLGPGLYASSYAAGTIAGNYFGIKADGINLGVNRHNIELATSGTWTIGVDGDGSVGESNERNYMIGCGTGYYLMKIYSSGSHIIAGNYLGLKPDGVSTSAGWMGLYIYGSGNYRIGTNGDGVSDTEERNIIVGGSNADLVINGGTGIVAGNYIGLKADGLTAAIAKVEISSSSIWTIGTNGDGIGDNVEKNYIAARVSLQGSGNHVIAGNVMGLNTAGTDVVTTTGIVVQGTGIVRIGTNGDGVSDTYERNVISGYNSYGISVSYTTTTRGIIAGNYFGLGEDGTTSRPNGTNIYLDYTGSWRVGTNADGTSDDLERNYIAGGTYGIQIDHMGDVTIAGNWIGLDAAGNTKANSFGIFVGGTATGHVIGTSGTSAYPAAERNLIVGSSGSGIYTLSTSAGRISGNYIGLKSDGQTVAGNNRGIYLTGTGNWIIGTNSDEQGDVNEGNYICGSSGSGHYGIDISSSGSHIIAGNRIGMNVANQSSSNWVGINIAGSGTTYRIGTNGDGTSDTYERNYIGGNSWIGLLASSGTGVIKGNYIGIQPNGTSAISNLDKGIGISGGNWTIGTNGNGTGNANEGNLISANPIGLLVTGGTNIIAGNKIGTSADGDGANSLENGDQGIYISNATNTQIGGTQSLDYNLIRYNGNATSEYGIYITGASASNNRILGNHIYDNQIDLNVTDNATTAPSSINGRAGASAGQIVLGLSATIGDTVQLWTDTDGDGNCEAQNYLGQASDNGNGTFSYTTSGLSIGNKIVATAQSGTNNTSNLSSCYTIIDLAPALNSVGNKSVAEAATLSFNLTSFEPNTEDANGTYGCTNDNAAATTANVCQYLNTNSGAFSWTPNYSQAGSYNVTMKAVDASDAGLTSTESITITVSNTDTTPSLADPGNKSISEGATLSFTLSGADVDGDTLTYSCSANCPSGLSVTGSNGNVSWTPGYSQAGTYNNVTFKVVDTQANEATRAITITVNNTDTTPSLADPGAKSVNEGATLSFTLSGSDTDGDTLTYSCSANCPSGLSVTGSNGNVSWTPNYTQAATYNNVTFKVVDTQANEATRAITITVNNTDTTPSLADPGNQRVRVGTALAFTLVGSDTDGDTVSYSCITNCPVGLSVNPSNGNVTWTPAADQTGTASGVVFQVSDTQANTSTRTIDIDVGAVSLTESGNASSVTEGGATDTLVFVLTAVPTSDVVIDLSVGDDVSLDQSQLTFTVGDWDTPQTVTLTAVNDDLAEGNHTDTIAYTVTSNDGVYSTYSLTSTTVSVVDNNEAGISVVQSGGSTNITEGGATDTYTVVLTSEPFSNVVVTITGTYQATTSLSTLNFTPSNWDTAQTVTVTAVDDDISEGNHTTTLTHSAASSDSGYNGMTITSVIANIIDNDTAGVTVTETDDSTLVEEGVDDSYTIVLTSQPTASVVITTTAGDGLITDPESLTFTVDNWETAQTVTVSQDSGASVESATISHTAVSTDSKYQGITIDSVSVTLTLIEEDSGEGDGIAEVQETYLEDTQVQGVITGSDNVDSVVTLGSDSEGDYVEIEQSRIYMTGSPQVMGNAQRPILANPKTGQVVIFTADLHTLGSSIYIPSEGTSSQLIKQTTSNTGFTVLTGNDPEEEFGKYVTRGDVDHDGEKEIIITAPHAGDYGTAYVYNTNAELETILSGSETYPIYSAIAVGSGNQTNLMFGPDNASMNNHLIRPESVETVSSVYLLYGGSDITGTIDFSEGVDVEIGDGSYQSMAYGDFNKDGYKDVALGTTTSEVEIYFGAFDDFETAPDVVITSEETGFGAMMITGDVNDDGITDLIIGSPDEGDSAQGAIYIVLGKDTTWRSSMTPTSSGIRKISGTKANGHIGEDLLLTTSSSQAILYTLSGVDDEVLQLNLTYQSSIPRSEYSIEGASGCNLVTRDPSTGFILSEGEGLREGQGPGVRDQRQRTSPKSPVGLGPLRGDQGPLFLLFCVGLCMLVWRLKRNVKLE